MATLLLLFCSSWGSASADVIISGYVYDTATDSALTEVRVTVKEAEDVSPALTNKHGKYTLVIPDRTEARLSFAKHGYEPVTMLVKLTESNIRHDVRLKLVRVSIEMTGFKSGFHIKGKVWGVDPAQYGNYKLVVYILTDQWYVHPYAENKPRRGFAAIDSTGSWEIETVWRGYQAYKVAFLLVPKEAYTAPKIELLKGKEPDIALLNVIESKAHKIIDAPEGI